MAIVSTIVLSGRRQTVVGLPGVGVGAGGALLYLAWVNRKGPGTVCSTVAHGFRCISEVTPWPFLAGGAAGVLAGVAIFLVVRRRPRPVTRR